MGDKKGEKPFGKCWRENQSFSQILLYVFSGGFLKINHFEVTFSGYLRGYCWFLGC